MGSKVNWIDPLAALRRDINQEAKRRGEQMDRMICAASDLVDRALIAAGKTTLGEPDAAGIVPIPAVVGPLRREYAKWVDSGQALEDYQNDSRVSKSDKQWATLAYTELATSICPEQALRARSKFELWAYYKYGTKVTLALLAFAKDQGITDDDLNNALTPQEQMAVNVLKRELAAKHSEAELARAVLPVPNDELDRLEQELLQDLEGSGTTAPEEANEQLRRLLQR